ncbi:MAG: LexA family transcriptional regulator [Bacteroidetes bacterium]|nr:LexA family transcriptional regulator [Bacteroidota bacterium]
MATNRKNRECFLGKNLVYLRKIHDKTLEEMATMLSLNSKSSFKAYEEDRALPDIHKIMKLSSFFDVAVADLIYVDIEKINSNSKNPDINSYVIEKVPIKAAAGYSKGYGDDTFIRKLKTISIPFRPYGIARAFEIDGDSMEPEIQSGSTVVGIKIAASEIQSQKSYIVVTNEGLQCKSVIVDKSSGFVYMISKNSKYPPKHIPINEVMEMWEVWKIL